MYEHTTMLQAVRSSIERMITLLLESGAAPVCSLLKVDCSRRPRKSNAGLVCRVAQY
jgi:hypothetical protein